MCILSTYLMCILLFQVWWWHGCAAEGWRGVLVALGRLQQYLLDSAKGAEFYLKEKESGPGPRGLPFSVVIVWW